MEELLYTVYVNKYRYVQLFEKEVKIIKNIVINSTSKESIYEQIMFQIKLAIAKKELQIGDALPSVRAMAKMLSVSTLSVQRAYKELQAESIIESADGKGNFISSSVNEILIREILLKGVEEEMKKFIDIAKQNGMEMEDVQDLVQVLWEEDTIEVEEKVEHSEVELTIERAEFI